MPASVEKVMPAGVMLGSSRETTITPLASGMTIMMHSKQPQAVIGVVHDRVERDALDGSGCECW